MAGLNEQPHSEPQAQPGPSEPRAVVLPPPAPPRRVIQPQFEPSTQPWTAAQSRAQFAALAQLRWSIFRNGFRRKGGTGELVARILFFPIFAAIGIFPIIGCGVASYFIVSTQRFDYLPGITWGVFVLWQLISINIAQPTLTFDISSIVRFPLSFPRYLIARLFFGLLSASNVIGTLALVAADIGIGIARPSLIPWATLLLAVYALSNIFFTRMIFAWVDRWLSTRRAREIFTAFILFASLGFQYLNVTLNPGLNGGHHHASRIPVFLKFAHYVKPEAAFLPPGLAASSIVSFTQHHIFNAIAALLGLIAFAAVFLAVYAWRMKREFLGENLSELTLSKRPAKQSHVAPSAASASTAPEQTFGLGPTVIACLQKELIYLRRNTNQLYGFIAPVFMVFLFAGRISSSGQAGGLVFPAAVAYAVLGISVLAYNNLGMDGSGVQIYFLAPVRLRDVFLAKNLIGFMLSLVELVIIYVVISFISRPPTALITLATLCWLLFATFVNGAVGNLRSLIAPKKVDLTKMSRRQTSQLSALIALGVVFSCFGIGFLVIFLSNYFHQPWLMIPILLALAVGAFIFYLQVLNRLDTIAYEHREDLSEELCKA